MAVVCKLDLSVLVKDEISPQLMQIAARCDKSFASYHPAKIEPQSGNIPGAANRTLKPKSPVQFFLRIQQDGKLNLGHFPPAIQPIALFKGNQRDRKACLFQMRVGALQLQSMFAAGNSTQMAQKDQQQKGIAVQQIRIGAYLAIYCR